MTVGRGRPLKALDEVPPRERGPILRETDKRAKEKGTTRREELPAVVAEAGYGPLPEESAKSEVVAEAIESMAPEPRRCPHCGAVID
jgi:hypothetical protein